MENVKSTFYRDCLYKIGSLGVENDIDKRTDPQYNYNYRSAVKDEQIDYLAALRDSSIFNLYGLNVNLKIPKIENDLDDYINYKDEDFNFDSAIVVPKFKEYRQILSKYGTTAEENYPLEIAIPSSLHLPRNSRIILNEYNAEENKVAREWRVLSTVTKAISDSKYYTKIAYCVPARTEIIKTSTAEVIAKFLYEPVTDYELTSNLRATAICYAKCTADNTTKMQYNNIRAEAVCYIKYKVFSPSILY